VGGCASKTWSFSSACKNLGAQHPLGAKIWSSEKCALGGYDFTSKSPRSLDQTSPYLFRLTQEESPCTEWLSDFEYLHPFRRYSPPNFEVVQNRAKFRMFLPPKFFWGVHFKILDGRYKIRPSADHCAKFRAGRPAHLGDLARKEKTSCVKQKSFRKLSFSGGLTTTWARKKVPLYFLSISSPIIDRFSKFFHLHTLQTVWNNVIIIYLTIR